MENSGIKSGLSRLEQIAKCTDNLEEIRHGFKTNDQPMLNLLGQMDQWEELHRLLYEEEDDGIR